MASAPTTDLVPAAASNAAAAVVLFDQDKFDAFYAKLRADIDAVPVDLTTKKGRDAIASAAAKVRTEKASIDRDRKRLTQEWRDNTALVNGAWKGIEARLDDLAVSARKPLTEWEEAEKARIDRCNEIISDIHGAAIVTLDDTAESVRLRGMKIWAIEIGGDFGALAHDAEQAKSATIATLQTAMARLKKEEAERAELEKLRAEAAARAEADRIAAEKAEAERQEAARIEAEKAATERAAQEAAERARAEQERRVAAEKAEAERIDRAKVEAAERAQREAEQAARAEQERRDREHAAQLAEAQAERDRIAKAEADRQAEADRIAAEQAARDTDQAHRTAVMKAAKEAIMTCGADEETARKIVILIKSGDVPNVSLRF
jgi:hypothetical protein